MNEAGEKVFDGTGRWSKEEHLIFIKGILFFARI